MYPILKNERSHYDILAALNPGHSITPDTHCKPVKYQMKLTKITYIKKKKKDDVKTTSVTCNDTRIKSAPKTVKVKRTR